MIFHWADGNGGRKEIDLLPTASEYVKGGVKVGDGLYMDDEFLNASVSVAYELPTASEYVKGGVKVGVGLSLAGDVLNCTVTGGTSYIIGDGLVIEDKTVRDGYETVSGGLVLTGDTLNSNSYYHVRYQSGWDPNWNDNVTDYKPGDVFLSFNGNPHTYWVKEGGSWRNLTENPSVRITPYHGYDTSGLDQVGDIAWTAIGACLKVEDDTYICIEVPYEKYTSELREDVMPVSSILFLGKGSEFPTSPLHSGIFIKDGKPYLYGENSEWGGTWYEL